jgi:hypothetical protein
MATDASATPSEPRRDYYHVHLSDEPVNPTVVAAQFRRLHQLTAEQPTGFLGRFRAPASPIIEMLLATDDDPDTPLQYCFSIDDSDALKRLEKHLKGLFPRGYDLTRTSTPPLPPTPAVAVEYWGVPERRRDWQTPLQPFSSFREDGTAAARIPLADLVATMATSPVPMVYQVLLQPKPDWSLAADERALDLRDGRDTLSGNLTYELFGPPGDSEKVLTRGEQARIDALEAREPYRSFDLNARLVIDDHETAGTLARDCANAFGHVGGPTYEISGTVSTGVDAERVAGELAARTFHPADYDRIATSLPWTSNRSRGIVVDAREAPNFCLLDGAALPDSAARAIGPTPTERTTVPRPPVDLIDRYRGEGFSLGLPLTEDDTPESEPLVLPPALQPLHTAILGQTGAGKSVLATNAILANHAATDGASILVDPKGGSMIRDYLRAHFLEYGSLDDVLYFDCAEVLPAISFYDIRCELEAGVPRTTAVQDTVDHAVDLLVQLMGYDRYYSANRSPDVIEYLIKALFDPIHGQDAFGHATVHGTARQMQERQIAPAVSNTDLEEALGGIVANRAPTFRDIMGGVMTRIEQVTTDDRLSRMFNHVAGYETPRFDLADWLNEDVVIIVDTGRLQSAAQRAFTLVVLSNLWSALRRRHRRSDEDDHPLVNVYIEEAASVATSKLLETLLAQAREFDCALTLSMQFPGQLGAGDDDAAYELLNNVATYVAGNVPHDPRLAERLATDDMPAQQVANRLRALRRGQWLVKLPAGFNEAPPRPFLVQSLPLPVGHPEGERPLTESDVVRFDARRVLMETETIDGYGLRIEHPNRAEQGDGRADERTGDDGDDPGEATPVVRVDSLLPHTKRLPSCVRYDAERHALHCSTCDNRYDPHVRGMRRAIECCSSLVDVDRDDVPVCDLNLKLTPDERAASVWSDQQLMFLQAVYNAQQLRYDPLEYDLLYDSMIRLQEYVGIETDAVQDLIDAGVLSHDTDHPHRLFTVTPKGRPLIGESYRQGVDYGHGKGDLEESSLHVLAVEVGRQYLEQAFLRNPDSSVTEVVAYHDIDEKRRLDAAALDADSKVVVALEAERINHDVNEAVPADFDKMAACDPQEAIWVVPTIADAHDVLAALNDPPDDEPRVEKTYSRTVPPQKFRIDTPGCTVIYPLERLRDRLDGEGH